MFLKLFKNVVAEDLEMLLPYVRIQMRLLDHLKIGSSVMGGIATAVLKSFTAAILSPWVLLLILLGFFWSAIRSIYSFFSSKTKYMQTLSSNSVLPEPRQQHRRADGTGRLRRGGGVQRALCWPTTSCTSERNRDFTQAELDHRVEQWLLSEFGLDADFDVSDAVRKLADKELLVRRPPRGR